MARRPIWGPSAAFRPDWIAQYKARIADTLAKRAKERAEKSAHAQPKRYRDEHGRFISETKWKRKERAKRAAETRARADLERKRRSEAAKRGWAKRRQRALAKAFDEAQRNREQKPQPSDTVKAIFTDARWLDASWNVFLNGDQAGQFITPAGREPRMRLLEVESAIADTMKPEPAWIQVGIVAMKPDMTAEDWDRYDEIDNNALAMTYPYKAYRIATCFLGARNIATNLIEAGWEVSAIVVRVTYGDKP